MRVDSAVAQYTTPSGSAMVMSQHNNTLSTPRRSQHPVWLRTIEASEVFGRCAGASALVAGCCAVFMAFALATPTPWCSSPVTSTFPNSQAFLCTSSLQLPGIRYRPTTTRAHAPTRPHAHTNVHTNHNATSCESRRDQNCSHQEPQTRRTNMCVQICVNTQACAFQQCL